jgi:hypothetical protein
MACAIPISDNFTQLVKIIHDKGSAVLYVGSIKELFYSGILENLLFNRIQKIFILKFVSMIISQNTSLYQIFSTINSNCC